MRSFEQPPKQESSSVEETLKGWFEGPAYIATTSAYRIRRLQEVGFQDLHPITIDDTVEHRIHEILADVKHGGHFDPYLTQSASYVAEAKCQALLETQTIPKNALVFAADTMPMIFHRRTKEERSVDTSFWKPEQLHKLGLGVSKEAVQAELAKTIETIWEGYTSLLDVEDQTKKLAHEANDISLLTTIETQTYKQSRRLGHLPMRVQVNTGIAIRFPHEDSIERITTRVALFPERIYGLVRGHRQATSEQKQRIIHKLADQLIEQSAALGIEPRVIPGCINWGDPSLRRFLKAEAWNLRTLHPEQPEEGVYLGLPKKQIRAWLEAKARTYTNDPISTVG